jgi:hypothetical protein
MLLSPSLPTAPFFTLVIHFWYSLRRQAPPGCREGPIYLSGRRRAKSRRRQYSKHKVCMDEASLHGCQCRVSRCCRRCEASMCSNHGIDNHPTVDAAPSPKSVATRPEHKVFKLLKHHQSPTACAPHRMPSFLMGSCVRYFAPFPWSFSRILSIYACAFASQYMSMMALRSLPLITSRSSRTVAPSMSARFCSAKSHFTRSYCSSMIRRTSQSISRAVSSE